MDVLVILCIGLIAFVVYRMATKQPIIPEQFKFWKNNETTLAAKKGLEEKLAKNQKYQK